MRPRWHTAPMHDVILLPGLACDQGLYRHQLDALAPHHRTGVTDVHFRHDTLPEMAAALLAEHAPRPLVLLGSSMGGMIALEAALQQPHRVCAVALLGSSARADTDELVRLRTEACALFEAGRMDEVLLANTAFAFHPEADDRATLIAEYLAMMRRAGPAALVRQNRAVMARADLRPRLPALRSPLLVAHGDADLLAPVACAHEVAAAVPHARLEIVERCGHLLTMERPREINRLLLDWLHALPAV